MNSPRLFLLALMLPGVAFAAEPTAGERDALHKMLPELHLLEPAWNATTVHRESSVLLQKEDKAPIVARLGFPATEIISVKLATGEKSFVAGKDFQLSVDKLTLVFKPEAGAPVIQEKEMFPPRGVADELSPSREQHEAKHALRPARLVPPSTN